MSDQCQNCRFSKAYAAPKGECPPRPEMPKSTFFGLIAPGYWEWMAHRIACIPHDVWVMSKNRAERSINCQRFPEPTERPKTYWCGEYRKAATCKP